MFTDSNVNEWFSFYDVSLVNASFIPKGKVLNIQRDCLARDERGLEYMRVIQGSIVFPRRHNRPSDPAQEELTSLANPNVLSDSTH